MHAVIPLLCLEAPVVDLIYALFRTVLGSTSTSNFDEPYC